MDAEQTSQKVSVRSTQLFGSDILVCHDCCYDSLWNGYFVGKNKKILPNMNRPNQFLDIINKSTLLFSWKVKTNSYLYKRKGNPTISISYKWKIRKLCQDSYQAFLTISTLESSYSMFVNYVWHGKSYKLDWKGQKIKIRKYRS